MTRMIRRCKLGEETFDACDFTGEVAFITKDVSANIHQDLRYYARFFTKDVRVSYTTPLHRYKTELSQYVNKVNYTIHQALNAPVLATEEVLAGLPMSADVYTLDEKTGDALKCTFDDEYGWRCRAGFLNEALELGKPYRIFTIKDPKTLEYFLQFYTDGTPIQVGG